MDDADNRSGSSRRPPDRHLASSPQSVRLACRSHEHHGIGLFTTRGAFADLLVRKRSRKPNSRRQPRFSSLFLIVLAIWATGSRAGLLPYEKRPETTAYISVGDCLWVSYLTPVGDRASIQAVFDAAYPEVRHTLAQRSSTVPRLRRASIASGVSNATKAAGSGTRVFDSPRL